MASRQDEPAVGGQLNRVAEVISSPAESLVPELIAVSVRTDQPAVILPCSARISVPRQDKPAVGHLLNGATIPRFSENLAPELIAVAVCSGQPQAITPESVVAPHDEPTVGRLLNSGASFPIPRVEDRVPNFIAVPIGSDEQATALKKASTDFAAQDEPAVGRLLKRVEAITIRSTKSLVPQDLRRLFRLDRNGRNGTQKTKSSEGTAYEQHCEISFNSKTIDPSHISLRVGLLQE